MPALTSLASAVESKPAHSRVLRLDLVLGGLFLGALWFVLCRHLSGEWSVNEQYNYGWFVPFFALVLFWLRWEDRPRESKKEEVESRKLAISIAIFALGVLLPIRLFEIGNPDWRPLGWLHAASVVALTLLIIWCAGGAPWLRHFAFPVAFIFVAVPWITPLEGPIIQGLMRVVAGVAVETLGLLGIPAQLQGNLIRINNGLVGVNEACSGVRSLQTSLMIGLLFGELKRLSILRRLALVAGAVAIAISANFCRAVFLVWIAATKSVPEVDRWHDLAGYTIVGLVFVGSMAFAAWLGRKQAGDGKSEATSQNRSTSQLPSSFFLHPSYFAAAFCWILLVEFAAAGWYRAHETNLSATTRWDVRWPESAPNFHELKIQEGVKSTLHFDDGREVAWREGTDSPDAGMYLLYFFRWKPGTSTILRARAHRPDICLPSAGWRQIADDGVRMYRATNTFAVPFRHFAFARESGSQGRQAFAHAFYCLREDTIRPGEESALDMSHPGTWSAEDRWRLVREGIRNPGQQVTEIIFVSAHQIDNSQAEEQFAVLVPKLIQIRDNETTGLRDH